MAPTSMRLHTSCRSFPSFEVPLVRTTLQQDNNITTMLPRDSSVSNMSRTRQAGSNATSQLVDKKLRDSQKTKMFGRRFSAVTYLGFVVLQFFLYVCNADAGAILIAPQTQHALLNAEERATFFCQATGVNVYWVINGQTVVAEGDATRLNQGWIFNEVVDHNVERQSENVHNLTMEIPARMEYNNTKVRCVGVIHDPAGSDPVYLIVKRIYLSLDGDDMVAPSLHYVTENENTTFYCRAVGLTGFWGINGTSVDDDGETSWREMGYNFSKRVVHDLTGSEDHEFNNSLIVPGRIDHNNTIIKCIIVTRSDQRSVQSDAIQIIVMGAPSTPEPALTFDLPGQVTLEWDTPFSWSQFPVQNYTVHVANRSEMVIGVNNETRVQLTKEEGRLECEEIEFKVRASNALGDSEYGLVLAGFPIAPQLRDPQNTLEVTPSQLLNNQPQLSIKVQLPRVCSYQSTNYTVTIEGAEPKLAVTRGPFNGSVVSDTVVISEGLKSGKAYLVQVEFSSDTGALSASKDIYIPLVTPEVGGISNSDDSTQQQYIIIGAAGLGIVVIALVLVVIIIAVMVHVKKRKSMRTWSPSHANGKHPMVTNPIYDAGPVYETIPANAVNAPFRQHSASECSNVTTTSSIPPTPTSTLPPVPSQVESPYSYAPNQVDPAYALPHRQTQINFNFDDASYMIMNAVRELDLKRISTDEETNLDCHSDMSSERYVPEPCASMV